MSAPAVSRPTPPPFVGAPPVEKTLRKLFLTIFLRGYSARGFTKANSPMAPAAKLALILGLNALLGLTALLFLFQPVFVLSGYLHCMTFMFVGMFITASVGEVLFNKEEGEILLHRPIVPKSLLKAKIAVLATVSLWMAGAVNLVGFLVGLFAADGGWAFPLAHAFSTVVEALFCAGCAVLALQFCLRYFGRERVDSLMTAAQVILTIGLVVGSQLLSQQLPALLRIGALDWHRWWIDILPPAWFAGIDDALAGSRSAHSWVLAGIGLAATAVVLRMVFGRLAEAYQKGLKALGESGSRPVKSKARSGWARRLVLAAPLRWVLRGPVERAACILFGAYLVRDRDVKLRVYPGIASILAMPIVLLIVSRRDRGAELAFMVPFFILMSGAYLGFLPFTVLRLMKFTQQWKASEVFHFAPIPGPWALHRGAQVAVIAFVSLPATVLVAAYLVVVEGPQALLLMLPGIVSMPAYACLDAFIDSAVILSKPAEDVQAASRGIVVAGVSMLCLVLAGLAAGAWAIGWFTYFLIGETVIVAAVCFAIDLHLKNQTWRPLD